MTTTMKKKQPVSPAEAVINTWSEFWGLGKSTHQASLKSQKMVNVLYL